MATGGEGELAKSPAEDRLASIHHFLLFPTLVSPFFLLWVGNEIQEE
jgi:hypothetical protein